MKDHKYEPGAFGVCRRCGEEYTNHDGADAALYPGMRNKSMLDKLRKGHAIDVSAFPREGQYYVLDSYADDIDYCDAKEESWIWSIGKRKSDGKVFASKKADLYQNPNYECLWLR